MKYYKKPIFVEDYRADAPSYENAERLTVFLNDAWVEDHSYDTKHWKNGNRAVMSKLSDYENTGLMPHDVKNLIKEKKTR